MTKTKIFTLLFVPIIAFLGWRLAYGVYSQIEMAENIEKSEFQVIEKLKLVRAAQKEYFAKYNRYTSSWDTLAMFIERDTVYNVSKRDVIIPRKPNDPRAYLGDSIKIVYDTLSSQIAKDKLFPADKFPSFDAKSLKFVPNLENKEFELFAGEIISGKNKIKMQVIEVVDKYPLDKSRKEDSENPRRRFLRFGSRNEVTLSGNWE
jgi:cell division protein FtsB